MVPSSKTMNLLKQELIEKAIHANSMKSYLHKLAGIGNQEFQQAAKS
jgi:hypothetical protein